jgi:transcriptional regulator with XRE-family HTH domain
MDMELNDEKKSTRAMFSEGSDEGVRSKTSNRMFYEAQVSVIQKQLGNLEKIRTDLGLSQRKICQLLMVDPSAWTRWQKENEAPPHIWRALQWYMTLQEKIPGLTPQYFIGKDPQILHEKALSKIAEEKAQRMTLEAEIHRLKDSFHSQEMKLTQNLRFHRTLSLILIFSTLAMAGTILFLSRGS